MSEKHYGFGKYVFDVLIVVAIFIAMMFGFCVLGGPPANAQVKENCEGLDFVLFQCETLEGEDQ